MVLSPNDETAAFAWLDGIEVAVTVCDRQGVCVYLNERAAQVFTKDGGRSLIGQSLLDCHPEPARSRFAAQLAAPAPNSYTIEKSGIRKLIHQIPWYKDGIFSGVVELSFVLPEALPHFVRDPG
jgi:transcriptional regulator with PAS, ATPase and Fis domain